MVLTRLSLGFDRAATAGGDDVQRPPELGARGDDGVREVDDLDPDLGELTLQPEALLGSAPVITLEKDGESHISPGVELVGKNLGARLIHVADVAHDLETFGERDDRGMPLGQLQHLVRDDTGNEVVAMALGVLEDVEVTNVEKVEGPGGIADSHAHEELTYLLGSKAGMAPGQGARARIVVANDGTWPVMDALRP